MSFFFLSSGTKARPLKFSFILSDLQFFPVLLTDMYSNHFFDWKLPPLFHKECSFSKLINTYLVACSMTIIDSVYYSNGLLSLTLCYDYPPRSIQKLYVLYFWLCSLLYVLVLHYMLFFYYFTINTIITYTNATV